MSLSRLSSENTAPKLSQILLRKEVVKWILSIISTFMNLGARFLLNNRLIDLNQYMAFYHACIYMVFASKWIWPKLFLMKWEVYQDKMTMNILSHPLVWINLKQELSGSQLAKMKKSIPDTALPWNLKGWSSWSKKLQIYLKNYDLCENVEFGAISWKFDILSITA